MAPSALSGESSATWVEGRYEKIVLALPPGGGKRLHGASSQSRGGSVSEHQGGGLGLNHQTRKINK